ncbi:hypothetical protein EVAR_44109_1 [Eumeta japonica]|uniref:Uncharacterized protein n=1 Tax=Eumeta variegata TaxID=151549 RepID=A0A4C1X0U1_EUMVA|nr:hypothetical protein EVAR_44109_1 [Eumeta japonica]
MEKDTVTVEVLLINMYTKPINKAGPPSGGAPYSGALSCKFHRAPPPARVCARLAADSTRPLVNEAYRNAVSGSGGSAPAPGPPRREHEMGSFGALLITAADLIDRSAPTDTIGPV